MQPSNNEVLSPNLAIDAAIKEMLPAFSEGSQRRMRKAIRDACQAAQKHNDENTDASARHIFREFIPAFVLNHCGYSFEYSRLISGKTPDWIDFESRLLMESYTYERGGNSPFLERVKSAVHTKCGKYRDLITENSIRLIVCVYLDFLTGMSLEECNEQREEFRITFDDNKPLLGVLFFTEGRKGLIIAGQPYEFFCLTSEHDADQIRKWPIPSISVYT